MSAPELPGLGQCHVCGIVQDVHRMTAGEGRLVCVDVQACTALVFDPPALFHEEFFTDERVEELMRRASIPPGLRLAGQVLTVLSRGFSGPEWIGGEIQVARDEMRAGWKVRVTR